MNRINRKKQKNIEEHIEDVLLELEKDLLNFQITTHEKDKNMLGFQKISKNFTGK